MAEILAPQTAAANSTNVVIATGGSATLTLKGPNGTPSSIPQFTWATLQKQNSNGDWEDFDSLTATNRVRVLSAVGTFRVSKPQTSVAVGVDSDA